MATKRTSKSSSKKSAARSAKPRRPAKKSLTAVCRDPQCLGVVVRQMIGAVGEHGDALWTQVLKIWSEGSGADVVELKPPDPIEPKQKLRAKAAHGQA